MNQPQPTPQPSPTPRQTSAPDLDKLPKCPICKQPVLHCKCKDNILKK